MRKEVNKLRVFAKMIARMQYYGFGYAIDQLKRVLGIRTGLSAVEYKKSTYPSIAEKDIPHELEKWFYASTGQKMDIKNPVGFNQKIQWSKVFDNTPIKTTLADKYAVRDWVEKKIGSEYLVPLIGVWDSFDKVDFSIFPNKFALKCNHGCGCNIIVDDKKKFDIGKARNLINQWMKINYAYQSGFELQYRDIKPLIIAEEYMENDGGDIYDYKFYCFGGRVEYIHFLMDRKQKLQMAFFDRNWNKLSFTYDHPLIQSEVNKPDNLDLMIRLSEVLSEGFSFVRVDFYRLNDGTIRFGEMTFTPASGVPNWNPAKADYIMGEKFKLPKRA